jgi:hypothetical protein
MQSRSSLKIKSVLGADQLKSLLLTTPSLKVIRMVCILTFILVAVLCCVTVATSPSTKVLFYAPFANLIICELGLIGVILALS